VEANVGQDAGAAPGGSPWDPGELNERHFCRRHGESPTQAIAAYTGYLTYETSLFSSLVAKTPITSQDCLEALRALGRVSHSWQDYYAHAVRNGTPLLPLWGTGVPTGNPNAPSPAIKPPSFGWPFGGEHGWSEPASRDGSGGETLRRAEAIAFVADQYAALLPGWYSACACFCHRWVIRE